MSLEEMIRAIVREELGPLREQIERALGAGGDELLTPAQAAELLKVQPATLRAWVRRGALTNHGSLRAPRYRRSEVLSVKAEAPQPK